MGRRSPSFSLTQQFMSDEHQLHIIDDFLNEEDHAVVWTFFQIGAFAPVTQTDGAWRVGDGQVFASDELLVPKDFEGVIEHPLGAIAAGILNAQELLDTAVPQDWVALALRAYAYPQGSGLDWHVDDHEEYAGALIYYAHPQWNSAYGGELLISDQRLPQEVGTRAHRFDNRGISEALQETGLGRFVSPTPNRLVLLKDLPHKINPVSAAAGHHVRASVAGFFLRQWPEEG